MRRVHLYISGRVQGVCFRHYTMNEALKLGIGGWVRNLDDGRVEVAAEGSGENLDRFIDWCAVGPRSARVDKVDMSVEQATGDSSFEIR